MLCVRDMSNEFIPRSDGPIDQTLKASVGKRVRVREYCEGVLRFYGPHKVQFYWDGERNLKEKMSERDE